MAKLDKFYFDRMPNVFGPVSYVPVSVKVSSILRRRKGNRVLVSFIKHDKEDIPMLYYATMTDDGISICHGHSLPGTSDFVSVAEGLAEKYPQYRVRHQQKKDSVHSDTNY